MMGGGTIFRAGREKNPRGGAIRLSESHGEEPRKELRGGVLSVP